jgi:hypothetical protein
VSRHRWRRDERGGGPLSAWFGFVVFLCLLLFAVQAMFNLYATSVVTSVAFDAARRVAAAEDGGTTAVSGAEASAREALGAYGGRVSFDWSLDGDVVALRVRAENPSFLLPVRAGPVAFGEIDRTVRVRVERFR